MRGKQFYVACFLAHFFFIVVVCVHDTLSVLAQGYTFLPSSLNPGWRRAEELTGRGLGRGFNFSHPLRQAIGTYTRCAGIEAGYSFFAPNVPNSYKLVFEIHYPDGGIKYELPSVTSRGGGFRVATLLDNIGETRDDELREVMVKMVAYSIWRRHPDATMVRAVFGFVNLPTVSEFRGGSIESYEVLYAYDFRFPAVSDPDPVP